MIKEPTVNRCYKVNAKLKASDVEGATTTEAKGDVVRILEECFGERTLCQSVEHGWVARIKNDKLIQMELDHPKAATGETLEEYAKKWRVTYVARKEAEKEAAEQKKIEEKNRHADRLLRF